MPDEFDGFSIQKCRSHCAAASPSFAARRARLRWGRRVPEGRNLRRQDPEKAPSPPDGEGARPDGATIDLPKPTRWSN